jgi:MFS family permease
LSFLNALNPKNHDFWLVRIYFFIFFAGNAFLRPFLSLFFDRQGLSGTQIGLIGMIAASTQLIAAPLWGHASDNVLKPRRLLQIALLGSVLMMSILSQQTLFVSMAIVSSMDALLTGGLIPLSDTLALGISKGKNYGGIRLWGSLGWAELLLRAAHTVLQPLGVKEEPLRWWLFSNAGYGAPPGELREGQAGLPLFTQQGR